MKINITKKQYKDLITMLAMSNGIFGLLGDMLPDTDYKERSEKTNELEEYFLQYAKDFDCEYMTDSYEGKNVLNDDFYEEGIMSILDDYEEYVTESGLANKLAWRDFRKDHTSEQMEKMREENGGYFGVEIYDYEKKYWDEFEENGFNRLEIYTKKQS